MQGQFLFAGSLFSPLQFFQNHLVDFVDVAAAHGDDQVTWFNVVADILADIRKVLVFAFIIGFWVGFILWKPNSPWNFFRGCFFYTFPSHIFVNAASYTIFLLSVIFPQKLFQLF